MNSKPYSVSNGHYYLELHSVYDNIVTTYAVSDSVDALRAYAHDLINRDRTPQLATIRWKTDDLCESTYYDPVKKYYWTIYQTTFVHPEGESS